MSILLNQKTQKPTCSLDNAHVKQNSIYIDNDCWNAVPQSESIVHHIQFYQMPKQQNCGQHAWQDDPH